jgi:hypothetical protein
VGSLPSRVFTLNFLCISHAACSICLILDMFTHIIGRAEKNFTLSKWYRNQMWHMHPHRSIEKLSKFCLKWSRWWLLCVFARCF